VLIFALVLLYAGFLMQKGRPSKWLPSSPHFSKFSNKIALGLFLATFLLNLQPQFGYPPITQSKALAQQQPEATSASQTQTVGATESPLTFQLPHPGYLSTHFSSFHPGIDIASGLGMPIKPIAKGIVSNAGFNFWGLGLVVEVDHGYGYKSLYAHMGKIYTQKGAEVSEESILGEIGLTGHTSGPHTHLEVTKEGSKIDPVAFLPTLRNYPAEADFKTYGTATTQAPVGGPASFFPQKPKPTQTPKVELPAPTPAPLDLNILPAKTTKAPDITKKLSLFN